MNKDRFSVAIDGPAGAGKSTISKYISKELGLLYIDTGAMFRALAYYVLSRGGDTKDAKSVEKFLPEIDIDLKENGGTLNVLLNGEDVSGKIRTPEVSVGASDVGTIPAVRTKLLELQRNIAERQDVLMDGRDIGSFVLPNANIKIFLTADVEIRAQRRFAELLKKGEDVSFEDVLSDMKFRDKNDSERKIAPLKKAEDAILADTSDLTLEESLNLVMKIVKRGLFKKSVRVKNLSDYSFGIENVELKDGFFGKPAADMSENEAETVKAKLADNGQKISVYTVNMSPSEHDRYEKALKNIDIMGIEYVKLCLSPLTAGFNDSDLKHLAERINQLGKKLIFEMRAKYTHFTLRDYLRFRNGGTGLVFNPLEYVLLGENPCEVIKKYEIADDIAFLRINDAKDGEAVRFGKGDGRVLECMDMLCGKNVYCSFREYLDGYRLEEMLKDFAELIGN